MAWGLGVCCMLAAKISVGEVLSNGRFRLCFEIHPVEAGSRLKATTLHKRSLPCRSNKPTGVDVLHLDVVVGSWRILVGNAEEIEQTDDAEEPLGRPRPSSS